MRITGLMLTCCLAACHTSSATHDDAGSIPDSGHIGDGNAPDLAADGGPADGGPPDAGPVDAGSCGGELAVSGTTSSGTFAPTMVMTNILTGDCSPALEFNITDGNGATSQSLTFSIPYDAAGSGWLGVRSVGAGLSSGSDSVALNGTAEVTALDQPLPDGSTTPRFPQGEVHVSISFQGTGASIQGSFVARYCNYLVCI
jgi:hypothetical protein